MKQIQTKIAHYLEIVDKHWQLLSLQKQQQYLFTFFIGYSLLSLCAFLKIGYDVYASNQKMEIEHIKNPIKESRETLHQHDTIQPILKRYLYEREK